MSPTLYEGTWVCRECVGNVFLTFLNINLGYEPLLDSGEINDTKNSSFMFKENIKKAFGTHALSNTAGKTG